MRTGGEQCLIFVKPIGPAECGWSGPEAGTLPKVLACHYEANMTPHYMRHQRQVAFYFDDVDALCSEDTHHLAGWGPTICTRHSC